jgi:hypothetical protein
VRKISAVPELWVVAIPSSQNFASSEFEAFKKI